MIENNSLVIYGCGGHARSIISAVRRVNKDVSILLVDKDACSGEVIMGCRAIKEYKLTGTESIIIGIGNNQEREKTYSIICNSPSKKNLCSVIAKTANIGFESKIGTGTFVGENVYIGPEVEIGCNTIINTGSIIEHETVVGSHTHIAPSVTICGRCKIGDNVFIGAGSTIIDGIRITDNVTIGAGATVIHDLCESGVYIGVPAERRNH